MVSHDQPWLFVTFGLQSYLHLLIVIYDIFVGTERGIVAFRIDRSEVQALDSFARLKLPEID